MMFRYLKLVRVLGDELEHLLEVVVSLGSHDYLQSLVERQLVCFLAMARYFSIGLVNFILKGDGRPGNAQLRLGEFREDHKHGRGLFSLYNQKTICYLTYRIE